MTPASRRRQCVEQQAYEPVETPARFSGECPPATARTPAQQAYGRQLLRMDILLTWPRFTLKALSGLRDREQLVARLTATYGLERQAAQRELDALLKGRAF